MARIRAHTLLALGCVLAGGFFSAGISAETLKMDGTENADQSAYRESGRPTRGMTQSRVEANYGVPQSRHPPVGDPPISRWDYARFVVYFEHDRVIHAVMKR
jgi:hypothetical protein